MSGRRVVAWATLVVAIVGSAVAAWAYFREPSAPSYRQLKGTLVAAVPFAAPTDAWVSTTGTKVLYQADGTWTLGTYGVDGVVSSNPVDAVSVLDDHRVYEVGSPSVLVIDSLQYDLVDGTLVGGDCYWCSHPFPDQPVVTDAHDGTWKVTVGTTVSHVDQPSGWDGRPPGSAADADGKVVIVAHTRAGATLVVDGDVCSVTGLWGIVSVPSDGVLLHRAETARVDYSVELFPRCG